MRGVGVFIAAWVVLVVSGFGVLLNYGLTPGANTDAPQQWPSHSKIVPAAAQPTLVVFIHPFCPCSRATLHELQILAARCQGRVGIRVVFKEPAGHPVDWAKCELANTAKTIPNAVVLTNGTQGESELFGAATSGVAMLFDRNGKLLFHGGITASRGHEGDNLGRSSLMALIEGREPGSACTPAFGCSL